MSWIVRWRSVEERFAGRGEALDRFDLLDALGREPELVELPVPLPGGSGAAPAAPTPPRPPGPPPRAP